MSQKKDVITTALLVTLGISGAGNVIQAEHTAKLRGLLAGGEEANAHIYADFEGEHGYFIGERFNCPDCRSDFELDLNPGGNGFSKGVGASGAVNLGETHVAVRGRLTP